MNSESPVSLKINPNATITWHEIGEYGTAVLQVDDFLTNPSEIRAFALSLTYSPPWDDDYYPGIATSVNLHSGLELLRWVSEQALLKRFSKGNRPADIQYQGGTPCFFMVKTIDADEVPETFFEQHADTTYWLSTVLHLSEYHESRGTAFWEHRHTGLQHWSRADPIMARRLEATLGLRLSEQLDEAFRRGAPLYESADMAKIFRRKSGRPPFSAREDENWRLLGFVPSKFNRLVAYPSWQIHSIVDEAHCGPLTVENMRFTMNQFISYPFPRAAPRSAYPTPVYRSVAGLNDIRNVKG